MARTTSTAVGEIIDVDSNILVSPFIEAANAIVTKQCTDTDFTAAELELIERWLAAHFYAIRDPRRLSDRASVVSKTIESKVDLGFDVTRYGQMAMRLDWSGALAALNEMGKKGRVSASVNWIGMTPTELSEYLETIE